jgi:hypothetical protein
MNNSSKGGKYWYKICRAECPVCGSGEENRYREHGERPADWGERHEFIEYYDYCLE